MKVLIVDDEAQIRRWIETLVQRTDLDIQVVGTCSNGKEALEACRSLPVEVVITDIKMPVMDGIELIRQLKEEFPAISTLIMSSYSEFHYASEALKAGASNYMLKAEVTVDDLRAALRKVQVELKAEQNRKEEIYSLKSTVNGNQYALRSLYFNELIRGKPSAIQEFEAKMNAFRLQLANQHMILMTISIDDYRNAILTAKIQDKELLELAMINIIDETLLTETGSGCSFVYETNLLVAMMNSNRSGSKSAREATLQYAHRIASHLSEFLQISISIGISLPYSDIRQLGRQFEEACEALNRKQFYGKRSIAWYNEDSHLSGDSLNKELPEGLEALSQLLDQGQYKQAFLNLNVMLDKMEHHKLYTEKEVKAFGLEIAFLIQQASRRLREFTVQAPMVYEPDPVLQEISDLTAFEQVKQWLIVRMRYFTEAAEVRRHPYSETIGKVCELIKTSYAEGISLQQAADAVHLNKTYLSELFKKETGISFNDYVTQIRIEKVKQLIRSGEATIGILAERVGYPDGSYLTRVFKKITGMTPLEFKHSSSAKL
ncbi:response regulator [Paenibacillus sp. FSL H8-0034]|uniref:response regulator n=1 Tax=Paenibacillus sp. FSL H8-0034 TaxID=2954671 RepID=UPI0030F528BF